MALRQQKSLKRLKRKPTTSSQSLKKASPSQRSTVKSQICAFAARKIAELRSQKTDVSEVSEGKGQEATELGS